MDDLRGIDYLRAKLARKRTRVLLRYQYYEMKQLVRDFDISTPPDLRWWMSTLGWCAKAVDALADRLVFHEFGADNLDMMSIYANNNADVLFDSSVLSALIASCAFIYISQRDDGYPQLQAIDGGNATGIIDPITMMLREGYAVLERNTEGVPTLEAYFTKGETVYYEGGRRDPVRTVPNVAPYPLLVPVINRPDAVRPFGHSRISRACMDLVGSALRTVKRSEVSAEFYSYPQKYVTGLSQDADEMDKWRASMSSMLTFTKDDEGDSPTVGQFSQQAMTPHIEQLRMFASLFAGETGLTLDDLGIVSGNPSSADAIKASHESLRLTARKAQRTFGVGILNAGYLAACLRDDYPYDREVVNRTRVKWEPIFETSVSQLSGMGDAVMKIRQSFPDYFTEEKLRDLTGI
jgi:hypothetical protein